MGLSIHIGGMRIFGWGVISPAGLSDVIGAMVTFPSLAYVSWWMANG